MRMRVAVPEQHVHPDVIDAVLEGVTRLDEHMIRAGQSPTSHELIKQGAVWRPEPPGDEHFDHGGTIAARGWGDCDDWAPLHAATLRASGEDPGAAARVIPSGPTTYHAIVERSDGSIDDPSIAAGMKSHRVSGPDEPMTIWACDPHDGRIYQGSLLPTIAPLSIHCGPGIAVRGVTIVGHGEVFEARCDMPLVGSPLVHVHSYWRHRHLRTRGRHVSGSVPYAVSCTGFGRSPAWALNDAISGAILIGDAAELNTSLDRYKLLAAQGALSGLSPGQVRDGLIAQMTADLQSHAATTGTDPAEHSGRLLEELAGESSVLNGHVVIGDFFSDIAHVASGIVHTVSDVANSVAKAAGSIPWGDIVHDVQAAVSVVPGIGTAVSEVISAAETAYDTAAAAMHGNPLEAAIHGAVNFSLAAIPGASALRPILDPVISTLINVTAKREPVESAILNGVIDAVPDAPKFGPISPRSIASSLAHLVISHLGVKKTPGQVARPVPKPAASSPLAHLATLKPPPPAAKRPPPAHSVVRLAAMHKAKPRPTAKPPGVAHAAVHVTAIPHMPKLSPSITARAGSPGAPPGATHWVSIPLPHGGWQSRWI